MNWKRSLPFVVGLMVTAAASSAHAQSRADSTVVSGRVTSEGGVPIASAVVTIPGAHVSTQTNDAGAYRLTALATGRPDSVRVTRLGYRPGVTRFSLAPGQVTVNVVMTATAVSLEQVVVT